MWEQRAALGELESGSGSLDNDGQEGIQQQLINSALETDTGDQLAEEATVWWLK